MPRKVEISHRTIIFTVLFLMGVWFVFFIHDIILQVFVALLIMVILNPLVRKLSRFKIPRAVSVLVVYLLAVAILVVAFANIIPALIEQTANFASGLALNAETLTKDLKISPYLNGQISNQILSQVGNIPGRIAGFAISIFSNIVNILAILTFAFYFLLTRDRLDKLDDVVGEKRALEIKSLIDELELKLGGWARGQLLLMTTVGLFTYLGLSILGEPFNRFAVPLAIIAGILEVVPYIGPWIAAFPLVIIGLGASPLMGLVGAALAFLIQQIEAYILVPKIMEKSVGISPVGILLALAIGLKVAGIGGILISVPVLITLQIVIRRYLITR